MDEESLINLWITKNFNKWQTFHDSCDDDADMKTLPLYFTRKFLVIFTDVLLQRIDAPSAATLTADLVSADTTQRSEILTEDCDLFPHIWMWILDAAKALGNLHRAQLLAAFLAALAAPPTARGTAADAGVLDEVSRSLWRKLPWFGMSAREEWNGPLTMCDSSDVAETSYPECARRWLNLNRFVAFLVHEHSRSVPLFASYRRYGMWSIADGLEYEDFGDSCGMGLLALPASCAWFTIAAAEVASLIGLDEVGLEGPLWKKEDPSDGSGHLTRERWTFWGRRLEAFAARLDLSEELRMQVAGALASYSTVK